MFKELNYLGKKLTYEEVKAYIEGKEGNGCKLLSEEYINSATKLEIQCKCGDLFLTEWNTFTNMKKRQCNKCGNKGSGSYLRFSFLEVKEFIEKNSQCKLISKNYQNNSSKLILLCSCGKEFTASFACFKNRNQRQCITCGKSTPKTETTIIKKYVEGKKGNGCKLITEKYLGQKHKIEIRCACGEIFKVKFNNFKYNNKKQCNNCSSIRSLGEIKTKEVLNKYKIRFKEQYQIKGENGKCSFYYFDFAIFLGQKLSSIIEYDGRQHFEIAPHWGIDSFRRTQKNDQIKNQYCKDNNIPLIRIPYYHFDYIEDILEYELGKLGLI